MTESEWRKRELDRWLANEVMKRRMAMTNEQRFHRPSRSERDALAKQLRADMAARRSRDRLRGTR